MNDLANKFISPEELESMILGKTETQNIDFKADMAWEVSSFCKDILAMSNVKDGGFIIVGIEDKTYVRQGVSSINKATYDIDIMRDQMTKFADPHVIFSKLVQEDIDGKEYLVIRVAPFQDIPVVCRKDDEKARVKAGEIYYRNSNRRVESARVSNSYDMRDIIEYATVKMMQRKHEFGFLAKDEIEVSQLFKQERGNL